MRFPYFPLVFINHLKGNLMLCTCECRDADTEKEVKCECGGKLIKIGKQACNDVYRCEECGKIIPLDNGGCG